MTREVDVLVSHRELSEPDGPIREPGDDVPSWRDLYTPEELAIALEYQAAHAAKRGDYLASAELSMAAVAIRELSEDK